MCVCIDGWMAAGGVCQGIDRGRIGRDGIIVVGRIGIGRTYPRRMIMIIISGCRACAQWCSSSSRSSGGSTAQAKASALIRKREMICNGKTRLGLAKGKEGKLDAAPTWDDWS